MLYHVAKFIVTLYFYIYHRVSIYGKENLPEERPVILASNHASYLDPPLVALGFTPERLNFIAWDGLFKNKLFGAIISKLGALPLNRESKNGSAALLRMVMGLLEEGRNVYICPEGHRTLDGNIQPIEGGVAILSMKTGTPIVPVWVGGTYRALSPHMKIPRPQKLTVTFGPVIDPATFPEELTEREKRRLILDKVESFYTKMDNKDKEKYPR